MDRTDERPVCERILVAVKFGHPCRCSIEYAARLAHHHGCELIAIHVVPEHDNSLGSTDNPYSDLRTEMWRKFKSEYGKLVADVTKFRFDLNGTILCSKKSTLWGILLNQKKI